MNKSLSYVNLSLKLHVVSPFWLGSDTSDTFSLYFAQPSYELERPALKMHILWCRTDICSCKLSAKVSLVLDNPFPVPSLCKLNHISVCFIQISTKSAYSLLESNVFFEVIPGVLGHSVNFNITWRFLLRRPVFPDYSFPCAYAHVLIIYIFKKNKKCQVEHAEKKQTVFPIYSQM